MHRFHSFFILMLTAGGLVAADPTERDVWLWPFASTSIWNMPIGSGAVYVPAGLTRSQWLGTDQESHYRLSVSDPVRQVYPPSSWNMRWPGDSAWPYRYGVQWSMPVPDNLIIPDAVGSNTSNEACSFLMPDGRELRQLEPACRVVAGAQFVGWPAGPIDIYGSSPSGTHFGSGLGTLGGSIRLGELTGPDPIRHAIKWNLWGHRLCYDQATSRGYRWPADRNDGYAATGYVGINPSLTMGSLLALQPAVTVASLGVTTPVGAKLVAVLKDYGAYVSDDSGGDEYDLCCEKGVVAELYATGYALWENSGPMSDDLQRIIAALAVVDNNGPTSIGGGGTPRRPLAPPLADPAYPVPGNLAASGSAGAVHLSWIGPSGSETGFELQRRPTGGTWATLATLGVNSTTRTDSTVVAGSFEYRIRLLITPNASAWSVATSIIVTGSGSAGSISRDMWTSVAGTSIANIPLAATPNISDTLSSFQGPTNWADNYGTRIRGYVVAPTSGAYVFWISGDDNCELWLSSNDQPATKVRIATVPGWTVANTWGTYSEQKSVAITMVAGARYYIEALQKEGGGGDSISVGWARPGQANTAPSEIIPGSVLSPFAGSTALLAGWTAGDVGYPGASGLASVSNGQWTVGGFGADIWNNADALQFVSMPVNGDVRITAKVVSQANTNAWAKAGVMLRESRAAGSRQAFTCVTATQGTAFQRRLTTAGGSTHTTGGANQAPYWVRLERIGTVCISSVFVDGATWTEILRETIAIPAQALIGLAVTSHAAGVVNNAVFSDVVVVAGTASTN